MLIKLYIAILVIAMAAIAVLGTVSVKRRGCKLFVRFDIQQAESNSFWGMAAFFMFLTVLFVAQPFFGWCCDLAESWGWSPDTSDYVVIGLTLVFGLFYGALARFIFGLTKKIAISILSKGQLRQRETCRRLRESLNKVNSQRIPCEELLGTYTYSRREICACCDQPTRKCPVGFERKPMGYINEQDLLRELELHKEELSRRAAEHKLIALTESEFYDKDSTPTIPTTTITVTVPFTSYYEGDHTVCLSGQDAEELERFLNNFVEDDAQTA